VTLVCGEGSGVIQLFNSNTSAFGNDLNTYQSAMINVLTLTPDLIFLLSGAEDNSIVMFTWSTMSLTKMSQFYGVGLVTSAAILSAVYTGSKDFLKGEMKTIIC
jgi:WD40 repeat protein